MKLYAFFPDGHGPFSFFVMAETEAEAVLAVEKERKKYDAEDSDGFGSTDVTQPHYMKAVVGANVVLINAND